MEEDIPEFALYWTTKLGANLCSVKRLKGGINNRVFRCGERGQYWVIKGYEPAPPLQRDRMQAEIQFLRFATQATPRFTPDLIKVDHERRCVVLEHLEGVAFPEGQPPSQGAVGEAVEFFRQLNSERDAARRLIRLDAAEGFSRLRDHLNNVRERVERMSLAHIEAELQPAAELILVDIRHELDVTEQSTERMIDQGFVTDEIGGEERCVSPSDFGFHNAIQTSKGIHFIDFEFSGWDDPAKTILDFALQPRVPIMDWPSPLLKAFPLERGLSIHRRAKAMGPIMRLKWLCIMLAVLQPNRLERIKVIMPEQSADMLIRKRLKEARSRLEEMRFTTGI